MAPNYAKEVRDDMLGNEDAAAMREPCARNSEAAGQLLRAGTRGDGQRRGRGLLRHGLAGAAVEWEFYVVLNALVKLWKGG